MFVLSKNSQLAFSISVVNTTNNQTDNNPTMITTSYNAEFVSEVTVKLWSTGAYDYTNDCTQTYLPSKLIFAARPIKHDGIAQFFIILNF